MKNKLKTFDDLEFHPHIISEGIAARMKFPNGYEISVIQGPLFYTNGNKEYEVAVLKDGEVCYSTPITDDVIGHQSREEVTDIMAKIQRLKKTNPLNFES